MFKCLVEGEGREKVVLHPLYLGVLVGLDALPWLLRSRLVDDDIGSVSQAVADITRVGFKKEATGGRR